MEPLVDADLPRTIRGLPSWVPDRSASGSRRWRLPYGYYDGAGPGLRREILGTAGDWEHLPYGLRAKGFFIDTLETKVFLKLPSDSTAPDSLWTEIRRILSFTTLALKPIGRKPEDIVVRTITAEVLCADEGPRRLAVVCQMMEASHFHLTQALAALCFLLTAGMSAWLQPQLDLAT